MPFPPKKVTLCIFFLPSIFIQADSGSFKKLPDGFISFTFNTCQPIKLKNIKIIYDRDFDGWARCFDWTYGPGVNPTPYIHSNYHHRNNEQWKVGLGGGHVYTMISEVESQTIHQTISNTIMVILMNGNKALGGTADFMKKVLSVYTHSMTTIYLSLSAQVAKSAFFMKLLVSDFRVRGLVLKL